MVDQWSGIELRRRNAGQWVALVNAGMVLDTGFASMPQSTVYRRAAVGDVV
jgi:hypothetical protein